MRIDLAIIWDHALPKGRVEVVGGTLFSGSFMIGVGNFNSEDGRFIFTNKNLCHTFMAIDVDHDEPEANLAEIHITETDKPFKFKLADVLRTEDGSMRIADRGVTVNAEINYLVSL